MKMSQVVMKGSAFLLRSVVAMSFNSIASCSRPRELDDPHPEGIVRIVQWQQMPDAEHMRLALVHECPREWKSQVPGRGRTARKVPHLQPDPHRRGDV